MRAISPPPATSVAAAALALVAAALATLAVPSAALAERWLRPVPGELARAYSYERAAPFRAGAHRGADLAAPPGAAVAAACAGRVRHAGAVAGHGGVVSVSCGGRRVSYMPLAALAVQVGAIVRAGSPVGRLARGHGGLHVGVRREGDPFGYEDPMTLLPAPERPPVLLPRVAPRASRPRAAPRPFAPLPASYALPPQPARARIAQPRGAPAPWPVWAGLGLLLAGATGSGTVAVRRRRRARIHAVEAAAA